MSIANRPLLLVAIVLVAALNSPVWAQAEINLPPRADTESPTGVSYKSGGFINRGADLSIGGPGIAGLQFVRNYASTNNSSLAYLTGAQGWTFSTHAQIIRIKYVYPPDQEPPSNPNLIPFVYTVLTGTSTSRFRGSSYIPYNQNGETLTSSGGLFTFTDARGAEYLFPSTGSFPTNLQSITYPDGTKLTYTYSPKLMVISNRGYALLWESINKVCVINMAEHYVTSATTICPSGALSVTYAFTGGNLTGATNALGQTTTYQYVSAGSVSHLSCIKDPGQSICKITNVYSACSPPPGGSVANRILDQVSSQTTGTGETYTYNYSSYTNDLCNDYTGYGVTASMTAPGSATTVVTTNGAGAVTGVTDPLGRSTMSSYTDIGTLDPYDSDLLSNEYYPEQNQINFYRDSRGNVIEKRALSKPGSGAPNLVTTASYPATCTNRKTCNKPDYIIDARGNRTDYTWDPTHGGMLTETRPEAPNGVRPQKRLSYTQLYAYIKNSSGNFVQAATAVWMLTGTSECMTQVSCANTADEIRTTIAYGTSGAANNLLPTMITVAAGDNSISATTTITYDSTGNPISIDGPLPGSPDTTRYRYDAIRRVVGVVSADPDGAGALLHRATRNTYDPSGNLTKIETGAVNSQSDADWTAFSSFESVDLTYDLMGRQLKQTKSGSGTTYTVTQYNYDSSGRRQCAAIRMDPTQWNSQTDACAAQTSGSYGPDRVTKNAYNLAGERTVMKLGFGTAIEADEETSTFTTNGKLWTVTDAEGNRTTYTYDGHDRLYKINHPSPSVDGVSSSTDYEQLSYDHNGNTTQVRLRDGQVISYSYDKLNRVSVKDLPSPESDVIYGEYDLKGHLKSATQSGTTSYSATWDALGRQKTETSSLGTMTYEYDEAGRRKRTTWPDGFHTTQDYYTTNEVRYINEFTSGTLALYLYDNRGNRVSLQRGNGTSTSFTPDPLSRLNSFSHDLGGTAHDSTTSFTYNPANQIATYTRSNDNYAWGGHFNLNHAYTVNGLNQATNVGPKSLGYDSRGNLTSVGSDTYSYAAENRLKTGPGGATLQYDPLGRLSSISKNGATAQFLYDGTDLVAEFDGLGALQRRFVHGPGADEPVLWYEGNAQADRRYVFHDERGSVVALSNGGLQTIAINTYDEYGVPGTNNLGRFSYTGQIWLPEIGLYYYKARMYAPKLGRFMQTDPTYLVDGVNMYAYVMNDPVNFADPNGLGKIPAKELARLKKGGLIIRNEALAGKNHPVTGIPFNTMGFPIFNSVATKTVYIKGGMKGASDVATANKLAGYTSTPKGYTWHHHEDGYTMQLVPTEIHNATGHTGGMATTAAKEDAALAAIDPSLVIGLFSVYGGLLTYTEGQPDRCNAGDMLCKYEGQYTPGAGPRDYNNGWLRAPSENPKPRFPD
jgi:RHS repeat-associated protein